MKSRYVKPQDAMRELLVTVEPGDAKAATCSEIMQLAFRLGNRRVDVRENMATILIEVIQQMICHPKFSKSAYQRVILLLIALACLGVSSSHRYLVALLQSSQDVWFRGAVLEAMLFEGRRVFEMDVVLPYVNSCHQDEALSALYALQALAGEKISRRDRERIWAAINAVDPELSPIIEYYLDPLRTILKRQDG